MMDVVTFYSNQTEQFLSNYFLDTDFRERYGLWALLLEKHAVKGMRAYDMGCGPGLLSFYLAYKGLDVVGVDASAEMLSLCEHRRDQLKLHGIRFIQAHLPSPEMSKDKVELVVCSSLLEYTEDLVGMIRWLSDLLVPKGKLIFSLPNAKSISRKYHRMKFRLTGEPGYYAYVRHILGLRETIRIVQEWRLNYVESYYYGRPDRLSRLVSVILSQEYSDNLFVVVFEKR